MTDVEVKHLDHGSDPNTMVNRRANRLIAEKSPYLLQHAHNPVDWYPWGDEAFEKARADSKPIFFSAGTYFPKESRFGRIGMLELVNMGARR